MLDKLWVPNKYVEYINKSDWVMPEPILRYLEGEDGVRHSLSWYPLWMCQTAPTVPWSSLQFYIRGKWGRHLRQGHKTDRHLECSLSLLCTHTSQHISYETSLPMGISLEEQTQLDSVPEDRDGVTDEPSSLCYLHESKDTWAEKDEAHSASKRRTW